MREPTNLDITMILYEKLLKPITELIRKLIREFFESGDASTYLITLGTIPVTYAGGRPQVQFDRDAAPSGKTYSYAGGYQPVAGDRVIMQRCGSTWIIIGKLVS